METLRAVATRYDRRSLVALGCLAVVYVGVAVVWHDLIDLRRGMDWLLAGIWAFMTALLVWDIRPRRDLPLVVVGFFGGLVIEWWGTTTNLWHYYTAERPPVWILPAWPVAALAIDRIARVLDHLAPAWTSRLPILLLNAAFTGWMAWFAQPTWGILSTRVVLVGMVGITLTAMEPRRELLVFVAGALLGISLEYWGTSRWCWIYYTEQIAPPVAIVAHGFASVAFTRGTQVLRWWLPVID